MHPNHVLRVILISVSFGSVASAAYILPDRFPRPPDGRVLKRLLGVSGPGPAIDSTTSVAPNQSSTPSVGNTAPPPTTAAKGIQTNPSFQQTVATVAQNTPAPQTISTPDPKNSITSPFPSPAPSPSPSPLPSPSPSPSPSPAPSPSLPPSPSPSASALPSPSPSPSPSPATSASLPPSPLPLPPSSQSPSPTPSPSVVAPLSGLPSTSSPSLTSPSSISSPGIVILTSTRVIATTEPNGSPSSFTSVSTTTTTPGLNAPSSSDPTGMTPQTRNTVIGVVVGVGGAIVLGALALVIWRIWSRRRGDGMNSARADYDPAIDKPDNIGGSAPSSAQSAARSPFQTTLENYHKPAQVNPSANF